MLSKYSVCVWKIVSFQALLKVNVEWIQGHRFMDVVMQAWIYQPGQHGPEQLDGPKDPFTGEILRPPVPNPPAAAPADSSISRPRSSRGPFRPRSNQTGPPTNNMVVNGTGKNLDASQGRILTQPLPAASIPTHDAFNNVGVALAPHISPYATNLDPYQQRLGPFSPCVSDASELPDLSRTLRNTPELSSSSRTSSVSAIPDAYLPARNSSYGSFHFIPGSPYPNYNSSVSSISNLYTPAHSRNQSGSSHTFQDTASDEACKVIIRNVEAGVTHEELSELLNQRMPRYVQHERPKRGDDNKWSVKFSKEEDAEKAKDQLNNFEFKEHKLRVHLSHGGSRRQVSSGCSTISEASSSRIHRPTIVDGSVPG